MDLVTPDIGLLFWMTVSFVIVMILLRKFAWTPIIEALKERDESIETALKEAKEARKEVANLEATNKKLIKEAKEKGDQILKEAKENGDGIVSKAKQKAKEAVDQEMAAVKTSIKLEKNQAIKEIKDQIAMLSIEIAEKILKEKLADDKKQKEKVEELLKDVDFN